MKIAVVVPNEVIKGLIMRYIEEKLGPGAVPKDEDLKIEVMSKQNFRVKEWETGELRVTFEGEV